MLRSYLLINSEQEELLKYESFKLEVFRYIVLFLSSLGTFKLCTWLSFLYKIAYKKYQNHRLESNTSRQSCITENCFKPPELLTKQQTSDELSNKPSPESIMGIATAAATAASVFMTKKRVSKQRDVCCGKCCALKTKHDDSSC